jgi:hypothetical protein
MFFLGRFPRDYILACAHHSSKAVGVILIARRTIDGESIVMASIRYMPCIFVQLTEKRVCGGTIRH